MENVGYAALQIIPSFDGLDRRLTSGTSGPLRSAGLLGGKTFGDSAGRSMTSSLRAHARQAAFLTGAAFTAAAAIAFKIGKDSVAEARESQKVGALTEAVIRSTGKAAGVTAKEVGDLSTALSLKSGVDDEVIQRGANMLLTFKGIRNEVGKNNDIFNQSVAITEDMAAAMAGGQGGNGLDLKSSSILVGKALNDPVKGLTALSRVGVTFTEQQKEQITSLAESGKRLEAQKIILGELKSEFGGAAAAQATMGEKVQVAWGNIEEKLGTVLLPLVDKAERAFLHKGVPAIEGWVDAFDKKGVPAIHRFAGFMRKDGIPALGDFYDEAKPVAQDVLPAIFDVISAGRPIVKKTAEVVGELADAFTKIPHWAQTVIAGGLIAGKLGAGRLVGSALSGRGGLLGGISKSAPLPVYVVNEGLGGEGIAGGRTGRRGTIGGIGAPLLALGALDVASQGKVSEIVSHPLRELKAEATYPFQKGGPLHYKAPALPEPDAALTSLLGGPMGRDFGIGDLLTEPLHEASDAAKGLHGDLKRLSSVVVTKYQLEGAREAKRTAIDLAQQYHLTPSQVQTLFATSGIPGGIKAARTLALEFAGVPTRHNTAVTVSGVASAHAQIASLVDSIHAIPSVSSADVPFVHGGQGSGSGPMPPPRGRQPVHIHLDDSGRATLTGFMDDRVAAGRDADNRFQGARPSRG